MPPGLREVWGDEATVLASVKGAASYGLTELPKAANREEAGTLWLIPAQAKFTELLSLRP